jgi:SAM-dependent methyltransferase
MNAERTDFPESTFDIVCASAVLHHLDLAAALPEIRRILKPGGRGCFLEPLGHNPAINLYRRLTPHLRSPNEHPLVAADLRRIRELFPRVQTTFFCLASFAAIPLRRTPLFAPVLSALEKLDRILLATQTLGKYSWVVLVEAYRG